MAGKIRYLLFVNGRYFARRTVPTELRAIIGKRELQEPLGADRRIAINQLPVSLARMTIKLDQARTSLAARDAADGAERSRRASPLSAADLARLHYQERIALDVAFRQAGPSWASIGIDDRYVHDLRAAVSGRMTDNEMHGVIGDRLDIYRARGNISAEPGSPAWREAAQAVAAAELEALERSVERDEGADPASQVHPSHLAPAPLEIQAAPEAEPVSLRGLLETHLSSLEQQGRGRAGRKAWPRVFEDLIEFLVARRGLRGNAVKSADDALRLTSQELVAWRDKKLETLSSKTIKDVYLASVKAAFSRAVEDNRLSDNPAAKVKVRSTPRPVLRPKGYTDQEAAAVLGASRNYRPIVRDNPRISESIHIASAKRWGPWLCAFTGARVTEVMQLRRSDVLREGSIHYLRITPEAGSVKSRQYRDVPLHPQLIDEGFLDFVRKAPADPLFYSATADLGKSPAVTSSGRLSTWLRDSKLTPTGVQPNHAWRHRFKTISMDLGLDPRVVEAIQGHAGRTAADSYGEVSLRARFAAIRQFPDYAIDVPIA